MRWRDASVYIMSRLFAAILCVALTASAVSAKHHRRPSSNDSSFDYYLLSLSWAPTYWQEHPSDHSGECRVGAHKTLVLHGLWPQAESGPPPMNCAPARPVASSLVDYMLQYFPSRNLIQHEWQQHGTCSGLSAQDYFHQAEQAFKKVQAPAQLRGLDHELNLAVSELEQNFAEANQAPAQAVRTSCHGGELVNVEICMTKDLQFRACSANVRDCPADRVSLPPPE